MQPILSRIQPMSTGAYPLQHLGVDAKSDETVNQTKTSETKATETSSPDQQRQIQALKARDSEVRTHEQAHLRAAGGIATGGASFTFQTGPDGKRYAIGGEVQIDTSPVSGDPEATLRKAETIRRAALAPASPSPQDYSVAASAASMATHAKIELIKQNQQSEDTLQNIGSIGTRIDVRA